MKNCNFVNRSLVSEIEMTSLPNIFLSFSLIMNCKGGQICRRSKHSFSRRESIIQAVGHGNLCHQQSRFIFGTYVIR